MNTQAISEAIRTKYKAEVETPKSLKTFYPNQEKTGREEVLHCVLNFLPGDPEQITIGEPKQFRTSGVVIFELYTQFGKGDKEIRELGDFISQKFSATTASGVVFRAAGVSVPGRAGPWWRVNVTCPWYCDYIA